MIDPIAESQAHTTKIQFKVPLSDILTSGASTFDTLSPCNDILSIYDRQNSNLDHLSLLSRCINTDANFHP